MERECIFMWNYKFLQPSNSSQSSLCGTCILYLGDKVWKNRLRCRRNKKTWTSIKWKAPQSTTTHVFSLSRSYSCRRVFWSQMGSTLCCTCILHPVCRCQWQIPRVYQKPHSCPSLLRADPLQAPACSSYRWYRSWPGCFEHCRLPRCESTDLESIIMTL